MTTLRIIIALVLNRLHLTTTMPNVTRLRSTVGHTLTCLAPCAVLYGWTLAIVALPALSPDTWAICLPWEIGALAFIIIGGAILPYPDDARLFSDRIDWERIGEVFPVYENGDAKEPLFLAHFDRNMRLIRKERNARR